MPPFLISSSVTELYQQHHAPCYSQALYVSFFYGADNKLGDLFSKEFGQAVPSMAVALVATAV